ncbi:MAG: hypothetical protein RLZZ156_1440 [Deinococcota bacterium]
MYATVQEFERLSLPADVASRASLEQKSEALEAASGEAAGQLARVFTLPLLTYGIELTRYVCHIAAWELAVTVHLAPEGGRDSNLYIRAKDARALLKQIGDGLSQPQGWTDSSAGGSGSEFNGVYASAESDPPRGW